MAVLRSAVVAAVAALAVAARPAHKRAAAKTAAAVPAAAATASCSLPNMRPPPAQRTFVSTAVDAEIASLVPKFKDFNLGTLFANTLPNALDTTVYSYTPSSAGTPDTFIVTGDIIAMWLRDSTNQVLPYLQFANQDAALKDMLVGLIGRQARSVLIDPYANAFQLNALQGQGPHADDQTYKTLYAGTTVNAYTPAIFERKYEVDSLANVLRLSALYYAATGDLTPFNGTWVSAVTTILATYRDQQQDTAQEDANGGPAYTFQRTTSEPSDSLEQGRGYPVKHTGMIKGAFRGSDDACVYSYNIPENAFASVALRGVAPLLSTLGQASLAAEAIAIATDVEAGIKSFGIMNHPTAGQVYAYEVDGFGNAIFMDDANIPSLLAMPYYNFTSATDPLYLNTRKAVLSNANPWYMNGTAGAGVGGPHNGIGWLWPMSVVQIGWSAQTDADVSNAIATLLSSSACTGLIHESFNLNDVTTYTRPWFSWVNSLFASFILKVAAERPYLIF